MTTREDVAPREAAQIPTHVEAWEAVEFLEELRDRLRAAAGLPHGVDEATWRKLIAAWSAVDRAVKKMEEIRLQLPLPEGKEKGNVTPGSNIVDTIFKGNILGRKHDAR